jgi:hypothetical protein
MLVHESAVKLDDAMPFDRAAFWGVGWPPAWAPCSTGRRFSPATRLLCWVVVVGCPGAGRPDRPSAGDSHDRSSPLRWPASRGDPVDWVAGMLSRRWSRRRRSRRGPFHRGVGSAATVLTPLDDAPRGTTTVIGLILVGRRSVRRRLFYERRLQSSVMGSGDFLVDTPLCACTRWDTDLDSLSPGESSRNHQRRVRSDEVGRDGRTVITFEADG